MNFYMQCDLRVGGSVPVRNVAANNMAVGIAQHHNSIVTFHMGNVHAFK